MGYGKRDQNSGNTTYFRVASGKLVRSAKEDTPGAVAVKNASTGETVWQLHDEWVQGRIIALDDKDGEFGKSLTVVLDDVGSRYQVDLKDGSMYWSDFLKRLPNVDLSQDVTLFPYSIEEEGRKVPNQGVSMKQGGAKVARAFTKENPNGLPQPVSVKFNGKDQLDWGPQNEFLVNTVLSEARKKLGSAQPVAAVAEKGDLPWENESDPF